MGGFNNHKGKGKEDCRVPDTPQTKQQSADATKSPIVLMAHILRDDKLTVEDKQLLYDLARTRGTEMSIEGHVRLGKGACKAPCEIVRLLVHVPPST